MTLTNCFDPDPRVYKEASYLVKKGNNVTILCWHRDMDRNYSDEEVIDGIHIVRFKIPSVAGTGYKQLPAYLKFIKKCCEYIKTHKYDYIHCNDLDGAIIGYIASKRTDRFVFDMHEFYETGNFITRFAYRKLTIYLVKKSYAAIVVNNDYFIKSYSSIHNKLFLLKNYPDTDLIQPLPKTKSDKFRIGYHGSVRQQIKEFTALFDAVKDMSNVRVDINGEGPDHNELIKIAQNYPNVHIHGPFDGVKELSILYQNTDLLFCGYDVSSPNYSNNLESVKFFEAICTGTPLLVTEGLCLMADQVNKLEFGLTCDTRDSDSIHNAIATLVCDDDLWKKFSLNELKYAHNYDWKEAVKVLDKIYV